MSPEEFLRDYWQKKPLLIRQALPGFTPHFSADELGGLALEEEVESRLVIEKDGSEPWQVIHGPLKESLFSTLPPSHWTLLVQEVNRHVPEVTELFELFNFIPAWRLDDIMVSYAEDQGSVGPHTDNYDVFLLQAEGKRHWQISQQTVTEDDLIPDISMRIMADFKAEQEWLLEPGDMLYLPPNVPHHGVAQGECMTYSVGFRAPAKTGLWQHYVDATCACVAEELYRDPDLTATQNPGLIDLKARKRIRDVIRAIPTSDEDIDSWFGGFITEPMRGVGPIPLDVPLSTVAFIAQLQDYGECWRSEETRFAYFNDNKGFRLFIHGEEIQHPALTPELGKLIADQRHFSLHKLQDYLHSAQVEWLCWLYNFGYLYFLDDDDDTD
ncbi:MAG: cupin domain-containing protein [Gammaproteobacteria bacterium]|nr:cupin domain-containing protein [Gammaproteobacteria bacterium]